MSEEVKRGKGADPDMEQKTKPTRKECIEFFCHECVGRYIDGKIDCENPKCPLYYYMPYKKTSPDYWWRDYSPRHKGLVRHEDTKRDLTEEQRKELADRLEAARQKMGHSDDDE